MKKRFKAWHNQTGNMVFWGELLSILNKGICNPFEGHPHFDMLQYTGVNDFKKNEICEGDIIDVVGVDNEVVLSPSNVVELSDFLGGHYWMVNKGSEPHYRIKGNIFQNPELIDYTDKNKKNIENLK